MSMNLMYSPLETIFEATMEREGRTVTSYTSGNQFQAFMRRNDDGNNYEDRITLFYSVTAPVVQGSLISYGNKIYILVNRETEENHCYYKSSGLACNGMITLNNGHVIGVPCYGSSMKDGLVEHSSVISVIDGNMEFITESNSLSRQIEIGDTFNEYGRTWKVDNIYYKDGVLHIITEVTANEKPYEKIQIFIDGLNPSYEVGDTAKLEATLYVNDVITTGTVTWKSSDNATATIDGEGNVSFLKNGYVEFTAYWVEKNAYQSTEIVAIGKDIPVTGYTVVIDGLDELTVGYSRTYTVRLYNSDQTEITGTWSFETSCAYPKLIKTTVTGNKIKISTEDDDNLLDEKLILTATDTNTGAVGIKSIQLVGLW